MVKSLFFYDFRISTKRERENSAREKSSFFCRKDLSLTRELHRATYLGLNCDGPVCNSLQLRLCDGLRPEAEGRINDEQTKPSVPGNTNRLLFCLSRDLRTNFL